MYNFFQLFGKYISYWVRASNGKGHGLHSPFIFEMVKDALNDRPKDRSLFNHIEVIRKRFSKDTHHISILDLGAGSVKGNAAERTISSIARSAAKSAKFGRLFYRMVKHFKVETVLELGTSLGLSSRYFAEANPTYGVITIEGAPSLASFTEEKLKEEGYTNIRVHEGDFQYWIPRLMPDLVGRKLIYVDGNHRYAPTVEYFHQFLPFLGNDDILIFDDIHWSQEMEKAWKEIKNHEQVACTVDLFFVGIVFFRKEFKEKLNFSIRF
ncbi:MAG: O-methyltransferase [Bacteroidota bacterium]|jgi:predicted O-methyltransferase YrrM